MSSLRTAKHILIPCFALLAVQALGATPAVEINLNVNHRVGSESSFDRNKYIVMHASLDDNEWDSDAQREDFLTDYDVYLGRNNGALPWYLSQTNEDPAKPGWPDLSHMATQGATAISSYASKTSAHPLEFRSDMMIGGQEGMYPNGQINGNGWALADHDALAEFMTYFLTYFYGTGGTTGKLKPLMVEVMNEPFVKAGDLGVTRTDISVMHNVVANRIHTLHPEVMVGGYTSAYPEHEAGNFNQWNNNWKLFMDVAGANMDFFSIHLYDVIPRGVTYEAQRKGSNMEAVLDLIEHYSYIKWGVVKPLNISEFGFYGPDMTDDPYTKWRDWLNLKSFSSIMIQLMERPNTIIKAVPFSILKALWWSDPSGNPYSTRLLRQAFEVPGETGTHWVYTELVKFYQLWAEVKGTRVDTRSTEPDVQVDAYVNGNVAYVILNNLEWHPTTVELNLFDTENNPITDIKVSQLYAKAAADLPRLDTFNTTSLDAVTIDTEATMILKYTFANPVAIGETSDETKYYAETYLQSISSGVSDVFNILGVSKTTEFGEAILRLGIGRDHGYSKQPTVLFNGTSLTVPSDWRGYSQNTRNRFFGVLEIPVPWDVLQSGGNSVSVTFGDTNGHIASVGLQVWEFSNDVRRPAPNIPKVSPSASGSNMVLNIAEGTPNGYFEVLSKTELTGAGSWATLQTDLPLDASGEATFNHAMTDSTRFYVVQEIDPPPTAVAGVTLFPSSDSVQAGGYFRGLETVAPGNADDPTVTWSSSNSSVATVNEWGLVTAKASGSTTITATTNDGGYTDTCNLTVGSSSAGVAFDNHGYYQNLSVPVGGSLDVLTTFDAGPGNTVTAGHGGIKYWLREVTETWQVVNDILAYDPTAVGFQSGASSGSIHVPVDTTLTADLPPGNFYFLFVTFEASDDSAHNVGVNPIIIVP